MILFYGYVYRLLLNIYLYIDHLLFTLNMISFSLMIIMLNNFFMFDHFIDLIILLKIYQIFYMKTLNQDYVNILQELQEHNYQDKHIL